MKTLTSLLLAVTVICRGQYNSKPNPNGIGTKIAVWDGK